MICGDDGQGCSAGSDTRPSADCWVFDVDGCLIDSLTGTSLRPGARELLEHLTGSGRRILLWSAGGDRYARERAEQFAVDGHVSGYFAKEGRDAVGCYRTEHLPAGGRRVFIDDRPEDLPDPLEVIPVSPYLSEDPHDRGLEVVARRAGLVPPVEGQTATAPGRA
jgi:long-chain acyl-CoA synthetase